MVLKSIYLILYFLSAILVAILESSFIPFLPWPLDKISPMLIVAIFLTVKNYRIGIPWSFFAIFIFSLDRFDNAPYLIFNFIIALLVLHVLARYIFTGNQIYSSFIILLCGHLIYFSLQFISNMFIFPVINYSMIIGFLSYMIQVVVMDMIVATGPIYLKRFSL